MHAKGQNDVSGSTHPLNFRCDQIFFVVKHPIGSIGNKAIAKDPTTYTIITLHNQNRKYNNQKIKILHLVFYIYMTLKTALLSSVFYKL